MWQLKGKKRKTETTEKELKKHFCFLYYYNRYYEIAF